MNYETLVWSILGVAVFLAALYLLKPLIKNAFRRGSAFVVSHLVALARRVAREAISLELKEGRDKAVGLVQEATRTVRSIAEDAVKQTLTDEEAGFRAKATSFLILGNEHFQIGQLGLASVHWERALSFALQANDLYLESKVRNNLATMHHHFGRHLEAKEQLTLVFSLLNECYPPVKQTDALHQTALQSLCVVEATMMFEEGEARLKYGDDEGAVECFETALRWVNPYKGQSKLVASILNQLAAAQANSGNFKEAVFHVEQAIKAAPKRGLKDVSFLAALKQNLIVFGDEATLQEASGLTAKDASAIKSKQEAIWKLLNRSTEHCRKGEFDNARPLVEEALAKTYADLGAVHYLVPICRHQNGVVLMLQDELDEARAQLNRAKMEIAEWMPKLSDFGQQIAVSLAECERRIKERGF